MKAIQTILILCLFVLLTCDGTSALNCVVDGLPYTITDGFINKFRTSQSEAFNFAKENKAKITEFLNKCKNK